MAYEINYEDQKFKDVETAKDKAISDLEQTYNGIIDKSDSFYQEQIDATKNWEKKQTELQNQQTDFAIQEIEQKKDQAEEDYTKEQSGAYADWKKQSAKHGVNAEQIADQGLQNTGFSESSQVRMYTAYQERVVAARETFSRIVQDFDNDITQARLQNNAALAEIAYQSLEKRLQLNLEGFNQKNQLLLELADKKTETEQIYHERWQDVLAQMNTENALAEEIRQFNESMAFDREQFKWQKSNFKKSSGGGGGSGGGGYSSRSTTKSRINKDNDNGNSNSGGLASDTRDSILALGQGPISATNLANQVSSGKVSQSTSSKTGNEIYTYTLPKK